MTSRTPNTLVIGAGPVAVALAGALRRGGVPVLGLWGRRPAAARAAAAAAGVASFSAAPPDVLLEADAVILAVRDGAIEEVAKTLVQTGLVTGKHVLIHCSGAVSASEAFGAVKEQVGGIGTLHPLRAISDGRQAITALAGAVIGVEGDEAGRAVVLALVKALRGRPLLLEGSKMAAYHAAAAMASNYAVALLDAAIQLFALAGVKGPDATAALGALAAGSLEQAQRVGTAAALTGPIRRGDLETVRRHLAVLVELPPIERLYRELGRSTVALARQAEGAPLEALDAIEQLLA